MMKNSTSRIFALVGMIACCLLALVKVVEIIDFDLTYDSTPLFLSRLLGWLLQAIGVWGIYMGQAKERDTGALIGTALFSVAYIINTVALGLLLSADITDWTAYFATEAEQNALFIVGGVAYVLGVIILGISIIGAHVYPRWIGAFLIAHPLIAIFLLEAIGLSAATNATIFDLLLLQLPLFWACRLVWLNQTAIQGNPATAS